MAAFFDVITFIGVAAFFAWLELLPFLHDLIPRYGQSYDSFRNAKQNLVTLTDLFLASFLFNLTAVIADYFYHNSIWIGRYHLTSVLHAPVLQAIIVGFVIAGLGTLLYPVRPIRSIVTGDRTLEACSLKLFESDITKVLFTGYGLVLMFIVVWIGYIIIQYSNGLIVAVIAEILMVVGTALRWKNKRFGTVLTLAPIWLWVLVFVLSHILS